MRKGLILFCFVVLFNGLLFAQGSDAFHLRSAETTVVAQPLDGSSSVGVSDDDKLAEIEDLVSSTTTRVVNQVLDLIAGIDWSDWLDRILPDKFKEILASAGFWPIEDTALDLDMKEMTDMGKEVMDKITDLE